MLADDLQKSADTFDRELAFTQVYRKYRNAHPAVREAMCLRAMVPANLQEIREGDLFAGRTGRYQMVGFSLEEATGGPVYYCWDERIREKMDTLDLTPAYRQRVLEMLDFWQAETTNAKFLRALPEGLEEATSNPIAGMFGRLAGVLLDFGKLCRLGIPGLRVEIERVRRFSGGDPEFYDGMVNALDLFCFICGLYARRAEALARDTANAAWGTELREMAKILTKITASKPESFREAAQLCWLYALVSGVVNYGRMDVYLGDFYASDIDSGRLTEEKALELLKSLWQMIADRKIAFNSRVIVGGMGRPREADADRFALAAMEATRLVPETEPQLTLRFYEGMDPRLMKKALDVIGAGRIYPLLYNDDVNVSAVEQAFGVSREEALQYVPYGCGEYALDHRSFGSPNSSLNMAKALEAALHNGFDGLTGARLGLQTGEFSGFGTFDDLYAAYQKQIEYFISALAQRDAAENRIKAESAPFLYLNMLFDDCMEKGRSIVGGGAAYLGAVVETFGMVNAADSLTAIRKTVYEEKRFSPRELLAMLDANFEGHEAERRILLDAPKYGNDDDEADSMVQRVSDHICRCAMKQAPRIGFDYYLAVNINNFANVTAGRQTAASADGRRNGEPLANGNTPTAGRDQKGVTAFLNSVSKIDPSVHAGYVHNMKFSRQMFTARREKLEALLGTYFAKGGTQAMITVVSRGDLESALKEPEKYRNLIVRVGGFSARYVELEPAIQQDILRRTLY